MKTIFLIILATIIVFFVWNIMKRLFFTSFYGKFPAANQKKTDNDKRSQSKINQKVNWDAETVDYEEIKEEKNDKK